MELEAVFVQFFHAEIFSMKKQPCEHTFRCGFRIQKQRCEPSLRLCSHVVLFARIGCVFLVENASNYAAITTYITHALGKVKNTPVCVDGVYFLSAYFENAPPKSKNGHDLS